MNEVIKVIQTDNDLTFIIHTEGDSDFWHWTVSKTDWHNYWNRHQIKDHFYSSDYVNDDKLFEFVNSEENSTVGCSCGSFKTIRETINDLKGK